MNNNSLKEGKMSRKNNRAHGTIDESGVVESSNEQDTPTAQEAAGESVALPQGEEKTAPAPRKKMSPEEKKAKQNAYYKAYRAKLRSDPEKDAAYRAMKRKASKKFNEKVKAEKTAAKAATASTQVEQPTTSEASA